jgi:hypothetical protein
MFLLKDGVPHDGFGDFCAGGILLVLLGGPIVLAFIYGWKNSGGRK